MTTANNGKSGRTLLVAPYVGEIGWELMSWQGRVRWVFERAGFDRLVVLGAPGKAAFYDDMPLEYRQVDLRDVPGNAYEDRRVIQPDCTPLPAEDIQKQLAPLVDAVAARLRDQRSEVDVLWPNYDGTVYPCDDEYQRMVQYARPNERALPSPWVLLVQRTRSHGATNWEARQWQELRDRLEGQGVRTSLYPSEAGEAIAAASHADLAIGQSTGGLHLASLCGCPHVVWSTGDERSWTPWEITNRQRYQTFWNPLGTPMEYHANSSLPGPEQVCEWVRQALRRIGRRTGSAAVRARLQQQWRMRRWLVQRVIRKPAFRRWPWPVQRYVRYQMV